MSATLTRPPPGMCVFRSPPGLLALLAHLSSSFCRPSSPSPPDPAPIGGAFSPASVAFPFSCPTSPLSLISPRPGSSTLLQSVRLSRRRRRRGPPSPPPIPHPRLPPGRARPTSSWRSASPSLPPHRAPLRRPDRAPLRSPRGAVAAHLMRGRAGLLRCPSHAMLTIDGGVSPPPPHWPEPFDRAATATRESARCGEE